MPESESREMYLKSIYELADEGELVAVSSHRNGQTSGTPGIDQSYSLQRR